MSASTLRRYSSWLLPFLAGLVLVLAGARLITVSVREHAEQMRTTAQKVVAGHAASIEAQLLLLASRTRAESGRIAAASPAGPDAALPAALTPAAGTLWMDSRGAVLRAPRTESATASALASEWASSASAQSPTGGLFGPVRYGSQWIVATRAPLRPGVWVVGYENLDTLLARAKFGTLVNEGYDFELYQIDPATRQPRVFLSSRPAALSAPAIGAVYPAANGGSATRLARDFLALAIEPRTGWYPMRDLATEIGLLAVLTWALAFGMYDLTHSLKRTRAVLESTRKRLHTANERLAREVEQRESLQRSFEHARYHDTFTGLPNRRFFMDQLDRALREVRTRRRERIAIVLIDIERFKLISDTLGHTAGDELLLQVAQRCAQALGDTQYLLARRGLDQLAVLLFEVASVAAAQAVANELQDVRQEPFELRQHRISVTSRVGFTVIDSGLQRAEDALREADLALSVAKQQQGPRIVSYAPGMAGAAVSLVSLEADLHVALDRNEFHLLFQPIVDLRRQRVVGTEALLRWQHPVEGLLHPDKFLAIAEEVGVIVPITHWVIKQVCRQAAEWRRRLPQGSGFYISVNLSAAALRSPDLRDCVSRALRDTHIPAEHLKFELSEGDLVSNVTTARAVLDELHEMGIQLMLDDFGSGYSSLSYLQLFPFDYVKIDRPFVSRTGSERANNAITSAILHLASNLGLQAVAEIVETQAAAQTLLEMGCHLGQGYFFSPPVEAEEAFRQLRTSEGYSASASVGEQSVAQQAFADELEDDSPTLVLPPGVLLESRMTDEADEAQEERSTT
jgi:diguanylate cyclase (GGDEF)-like protein